MAPDPKAQRKAWAQLDQLDRQRDNLYIVHYACESFYNRPNGSTPRIACIALRRFVSGQTQTFAIHHIAEQRGVAYENITAHYEALERKLLDAFFKRIKDLHSPHFVHWNMRDDEYGFYALERRHRVLGGRPYIVEDTRKSDLAILMHEIYGDDYVKDPKLEHLYRRNGNFHDDFKTGKEEAEAFDRGDFLTIHRSTRRKADVLSLLLTKAIARSLDTNASLWDLHGGRLRESAQLIKDNPIISLAISGIGILLAIVGLLARYMGWF